MVAYSFQREFAPAIRAGLGLPAPAGTLPKRQTMRAERKEGNRHARVGEELQLSTGMRTKRGFLIGLAQCTKVEPSRLLWRGPHTNLWINRAQLDGPALEQFALDDGFAGLAQLVEFWQSHHRLRHGESWHGVIIYWQPITKEKTQ